MTMKLKEAREISGGLSRTTKMPGASYSLPAFKCPMYWACRGDGGTVCHYCYAAKGNYRFPGVQRAQERRWEALGHPKWVEAMETLIRNEFARQKQGEWFRWHDSGCLRDADHLVNIITLAQLIPEVRFWLPCRVPAKDRRLRESRIKLILDALERTGPPPDNLVVRFSGEMLDDPGEMPEELLAAGFPDIRSSVHTKTPPEGSRDCPAVGGAGRCGDCRACWDPGVPLVSYHKH